MKPEKKFRWQKGRLSTRYEKMLLLDGRWPVGFDVYLLRYPEGSEVPAHRDPVPDHRHYRLNLILRKAGVGGEFECERVIFGTKRLKIFRPDLEEHRVMKVLRGRRYVLSIGWVTKSNSNVTV